MIPHNEPFSALPLWAGTCFFWQFGHLSVTNASETNTIDGLIQVCQSKLHAGHLNQYGWVSFISPVSAPWPMAVDSSPVSKCFASNVTILARSLSVSMSQPSGHSNTGHKRSGISAHVLPSGNIDRNYARPVYWCLPPARR